MKKFLSAGLAIATAVLTFVFFSIPCLTTKIGDRVVTDRTGWQMLSDFTADFNGFTLYQIFAIVTMIVAGLIVIVSLIMILQQLNVIKSKANFGFINSMLLVIYTITALVTMIGGIVLGNGLSIEITKTVVAVNIGLILPWIISLIVSALSFVLNRNSK